MPAELFLVVSLYNSNQCGNTVHLTKLQLPLPRPFFPLTPPCCPASFSSIHSGRIQKYARKPFKWQFGLHTPSHIFLIMMARCSEMFWVQFSDAIEET